jgi:hypothetical protein
MKILRDWDRDLQMCPLNEEFPVSVGHKLALITSLPFVHTARRCPGLSRFEKNGDCWLRVHSDFLQTETILIAAA